MGGKPEKPEDIMLRLKTHNQNRTFAARAIADQEPSDVCRNRWLHVDNLSGYQTSSQSYCILHFLYNHFPYLMASLHDFRPGKDPCMIVKHR